VAAKVTVGLAESTYRRIVTTVYHLPSDWLPRDRNQFRSQRSIDYDLPL